MPDTISTVQGQAWDMIAKDRLGGEFTMHRLMAENIDAMGVLLFSGDITLTLPDIQAREVKPLIESLPPWKR